MLIGFITGIGLGCIYFGGLFLTTQRMGTVGRPELLMGASLILRFAVMVAGFYLLSQQGVLPPLFGLFGVILVRIGMIRFLGGKRYEH